MRYIIQRLHNGSYQYLTLPDNGVGFDPGWSYNKSDAYRFDGKGEAAGVMFALHVASVVDQMREPHLGLIQYAVLEAL